MHVRLGSRSPNDFITKLNSKNGEIQRAYQRQLAAATRTVKAKVMLGDSTITEQTTFDPMLVADFYRAVVKRLDGWTIQDVSTTNNDDLRRIFTKFEVMEGNYILAGHMSIQFHVLLYYKPDYRVVERQKELAALIDKTKDSQKSVSDMGEDLVEGRLREAGYADLGHQDLFEILYKDDKLREKIHGEIEEGTDVDFREMSKKKAGLFDELDSFLLETYQTTNVPIDDTRLVSGEEGILCTFDLEFVKNRTKEGVFDPKKIPQGVQDGIGHRLDEFLRCVQ